MSKQSKKNLPPPYKLSYHTNSGAYTFTTDLGQFYACGFTNLTPLLSPIPGIYDLEVYDFKFHTNKTERKSPDDRISSSIIGVLDEFFVNSNRVLIYVCDGSGGRAKERQALFKKWHENIESKIECKDLQVDTDTERLTDVS